MAFDIMDLIKDQVTDSVMDQLGGLIGENKTNTRSAVSGAIPAIMNGLGGLAGDERGASSLFDAVKDQDDGLLDSLGDMLGGKNGNSTMKMGTSLLSGLMGNGGLGSLVSAVAGFSGMGKKSSGSLVGLLAPIVLGVVKRKVFGGKSGGTIGALTSLFSSQKDNIQNAMPTGLNDQLKTSGFFDNIAGGASNVAQSAQAHASNAAHTTQREGSSMLKKILPIAALALLAWFGLKMFGGGDKVENTTSATSTSSTTATDTASTSTMATLDVPNYGEQVGTMFQSTTDTFGKITDVDTAKAELPNLKGLVNDFTGFSDTFADAPAEAKGPVVTLAQGAFDKLEPVVGKVMEIPGVGDVIKPTTDSLMEQIGRILQ